MAHRLLALGAWLVIVLCSLHAEAQPDTRVARWWQGDHALGDWGGARTWLAERGVVLDGYYVNNLAGNPRGGMRRGVTDVHNLYLGLKLDLERSIGWPGAALTVSGIHRAGKSLTVDYLGSRYNSQQVFGGQTYFLYGVFFEQALFQQRLAIKLGRFGASDDFNTSGLYGLYMNNGIDGNVRNVLFDTQFSAYPFATWAARFRLLPVPWLNAQLGIYQTSDRVFDPSRHGVDFSIRKGDGFFAVAQLSLTPDWFSSDEGERSDDELQKNRRGHYWLGASISRWSYAQLASERTTRLSYGGYAHLDQQVYRERPDSDQGLLLWVAAGLYPQREIAIVPLQVNAGVTYRGLLPRRDADQLIVGTIYGAFSSEYARALAAQAETDGVRYRKPTTELVIELAYRVSLRRFLYVQPDFQWIRRPGGTGAIPDAFVVGAQSGVVF